MAHPTAARRLARFVARLALDDVPEPVAARAALLALDSLGNALAASREDFGRSVLEDALRGTVRRASFLGDSVDYQVEVAQSGVVLRVAAPPSLRLRPGESVSLEIDPAACVPLG